MSNVTRILGTKILKTQNVQQKGIIRAIESELGKKLSDQDINQHKARIIELLRKGVEALDYGEQRELMTYLVWPLAKHFSILRSAARAGAHTKAYRRYYMVIDIPDEDLIPILWIFFSDKGRTIAEKFSEKSGDLAKYVTTSSSYYIRDRFSNSFKANISIPRTRNDDKEETKRMKVMAASKADDEQSDYLMGLEVSDNVVDSLSRTDVRNYFAEKAPLIFSKIFLNLSQDEVFLTTEERKKIISEEKLALTSDEKFSLSEDFERVLSVNVAKWFVKKSELSAVIPWNSPSKSWKEKKEFLQQIGLTEERAQNFLNWLKANAKRNFSARKI